MDSAIAVAKVVALKLAECKKFYDDLKRVVTRLEQTVLAIEKLLSDRAKEQRLAGTIQDTLRRQLSELEAILDDIAATKGKGKKGEAMIFCGSCVGKGAAGYLDALDEKNDQLRSTLQVADSEVLVAAASAAEEMAGGAAGKHIIHQGARAFWRSRYQNELELSVSKFWNGIIANSQQMQLMYGRQQDEIRRCLLGRMDMNFDSVITVAEFQRFVDSTARTLPGDADMMNILRHAVYADNLRGAMVHGHTSPITAIDSFNQYVVTCDEENYLRCWIATPTTFTLLTVTTLGRVGEVATTVRFKAADSKLTVLAAIGSKIVEIDAFCGDRVAVIPEAHDAIVTSISHDGQYLFTTAKYPSFLAHIWRPATPDTPAAASTALSSSSAAAALARAYYKYGVLGDGTRQIEYIEPLKDGQHVCALSNYHFVAIFDFRKTIRIHNLEVSSLRMNYIRVNCGQVFVGFEDTNIEEVFAEPVKSPKKTGVASTLLDGNEFRFPETFVSPNIAINLRGRRGAMQVTHRASKKSMTWILPPSLVAQRVFAHEDDDAYLCATLGDSTMLIRFNVGAAIANNEPLLPMAIMSYGRWTGCETFADKTFFTRFESRHAAAFIPNPDDPHDFCVVSAAASTHLAVFNSDLDIMMRLPMRFSQPRMRQPITCMIADPKRNSIIIGALNGKMRRVELGKAEEAKPVFYAEADGKIEESRFQLFSELLRGKTSRGKGKVHAAAHAAANLRHSHWHHRQQNAKDEAAAGAADPDATAGDAVQGGSAPTTPRDSTTPGDNAAAVIKSSSQSSVGAAAVPAAVPTATSTTSTPLVANPVVLHADETATVRAARVEVQGIKEELVAYVKSENGKMLHDHIAASISSMSFASHRSVSEVKDYMTSLPSTISESQRKELMSKITAISEQAINVQDANQGMVTTLTQFQSSICQPERFMTKAAAAQRVFNGNVHCSGCRAKLVERECVWQLCTKCIERREIKSRCSRCMIAPVRFGYQICASCFNVLKNDYDLCVCAMAVVGDTLLVGALPPHKWELYDGSGDLILMNAVTLKVSSKLQSYVQGPANVAGSEHEGGLFAATISQTAVALFATNVPELRTAMLGSIVVDSPVSALHLHKLGDGPLLLISASVQGIVALHSVIRTDAATVSSTTLQSINARVGPCSCLATNGSLLAVGALGGETAMLRLWDGKSRAQLSPIMLLRGHNRQQVTAMHFTPDSLITAASDRCLMQFPLSIFTTNGQSSRKRALIASVFPSDTFYAGGRLQYLAIDADWQWRQAANEPWEVLSVPNNLLDALLAQRTMTEDASLPVRWRVANYSGQVTLRRGAGLDLQLELFDLPEESKEHRVRPLKISHSIRSGENNAFKVGDGIQDDTEFVTVAWGQSKTIAFPDLNALLGNPAEAAALTAAYFMIVPITCTADTAITVGIPGAAAPLVRNFPIPAQGKAFVPIDLSLLRANVDARGTLELFVHRREEQEDALSAGGAVAVAAVAIEGSHSDAPAEPAAAAPAVNTSHSAPAGGDGSKIAPATSGSLSFIMFHKRESVDGKLVPHLFLHCN